MAPYLFTWNPTKWDWATLEEDSASYRRRGFVDSRWSCGVTKRIVPGDRVFLIKLGPHKPTGIMASGFAVSSPFQALHYSDASKTANYIDLRYDILLNMSDEKLLDRDILEEVLPDVRWSPQGSGITIPPDTAARLEEMWSEQITSIGLSPSKSPDEIVAPERYWEGAVRRIAVDAYERNPRARKACLKHHGLTCCVCGFDFAEAYGDLGKGFIHVHHLKQLSDIGSEYEVDPIRDLVPVCPNCHAMLHKRNPPLSPEDLRITIKKANRVPRSIVIMERLGSTTEKDIHAMKRGKAPTVRRGPYVGEIVSVDHIIPRSVAPELDNVIANLELMPLSVNQRKGNKVGDRQTSLARKLHAAGLLSAEELNRVLTAR